MGFDKTPTQREIEISLNEKKGKKVLLVLLILLLFGLFSYISLKIFLRKGGINIELELPTTVMAGERVEPNVLIENKSRRLLKDAKLEIVFSEGFYNPSTLETLRRIEIPLGDIGKEEIRKQTLGFIVTGDRGEVKSLEARFIWRVKGLRATLEKRKEFHITLSRPAVDVSAFLPKKVIVNVPFRFDISCSNVSDQDLSNLILEMNFPEGYKLINTQPELIQTDEANVFKLGYLSSRGQKRFSVIGKVEKGGKENFVFNLRVKMVKDDKEIILSEKKRVVSLSPSLLSLSVLVNNNSNYIAKLSDRLDYSILYGNRTNSTLSDVVIKATLEGDLFDYSTINTDGYFDPRTKTIIWNGGNHPDLRIVKASQQGMVNFTIKLKSSFSPDARKVNPVLRVKVEIETLSVPYYVAAPKLTNSALLETKVEDKVDLGYLLLFRDAKSGLVNNGPWPPKVGKETQFTVHLLIRNYSSEVKNGLIKIQLSNGVSFTGKKILPNLVKEFDYNDRTGEISILFKDIPPWVGFSNKREAEIIFQIGLIPSYNQVGIAAPLIENIVFQGEDSFTGASLGVNINKIDTSYVRLFDPTIAESGIIEE